MTMDRRRTRMTVSRLLRQSILELCKASVPQEQGMTIDGIVCISLGNDDDQIVVKVHEQMGALRTVTSPATSSQSRPRPAGLANKKSSSRPGKATSTPASDYEKKRLNLHQIARAASAKKLKTSPEGEDSVGSSSTPRQPATTPPKHGRDLSLLTTIKTEVLSEEEMEDAEPSTSDTSVSTMEKYLGNASLDTVVFRDLECEHCKLLLPTFEELKAHNDTEHKAHTCGYCWRSFLNLTNYQQHLTSHRKMKIGGRVIKDTGKDPHLKRKRCGECQEFFRSFSQVIEHLRSSHEFERCFSCPTCEEYFPNRETFVEHRRLQHSDVQQCRCDNCEVSFTYVEYKQHERECYSADTKDTSRSKRPIQPHKVMEDADSGQLVRPAADIPSEVVSIDHSDRKLQLDAENVLGQILESEHSILEQTKALVSVKTKEPERIKHSPSRPTPQLRRPPDERPLDEEEEEDEDENDREVESDNAESEGASVDDTDASDILSSLAAGHETVTSNGATWELHQYPRATIPEKTSTLTCQGPYRCQTCYYVIDKFEDFERHCFEMHSRCVCTYCAQTFANRRNLQRHIRRHIGDMPYVCNDCGQRFYRDDNLRRHKLKHMTSVKFICSYCSTPCETKNKLTSHLIGGHAIDVLKVTEQEMMKHVVLKDGPLPSVPVSDTDTTFDQSLENLEQV